jgi:hypothetical protein
LDKREDRVFVSGTGVFERGVLVRAVTTEIQQGKIG